MCATRWADVTGSRAAPRRSSDRARIHRRARRPRQLSGARHIRTVEATRAARPYPGEGKIGGRARVGGRPIALFADDVTVKRASTSNVGARKVRRIYDLALRDGMPLVHFGATGGARIPDIMGSEAFSLMEPPAYTGMRRRRVPMVTVITGESFGGSSSSRPQVTSPFRSKAPALRSRRRALEGATGEQISLQELGGTTVHDRITGQIDLVARDGAHATELVRRFLSYLPPNGWTPPPRCPPGAPGPGDPETLVPTDRRRAWDMRRLVRAVCDADSLLELMPGFGRSVLTLVARIDGRPVGVIASQPMQQAGVLGPNACDKAVRLVCLCDAFGLPLVFLQDTPGFMVGTQVEHGRLLHKATMLWQAITLAAVPRLTVIVRKSYGMADYAMSGIGMGGDALYAWPRAEISFMDPETAANVLVPGPDQARARGERAREVRMDVAPYGAAGVMRLDEVIEPNATREVLVAALRDTDGRPFEPGCERPLASWPNSW